MTYRAKAVGKRRRDEDVLWAWCSRSRGRGWHRYCEYVANQDDELLGLGYLLPPPKRVRKRSGYRPSKERLRRLAKKARLAAYRKVYEGMMRIHWDKLARPRKCGRDE
jgi:hypothetical protein